MFDHFSIVAPIYERLIPPPDPSLLRELAGLTSQSIVLDAAGGTGRVATLYASDVQRIVVCDTSTGMLKEAKDKGLETVLAAVEKLPFEDDEFDAILLVDAFHHLENQRRALSELLRVLKPSGFLVIEEPDIHRPLVKVVAFLEKLFLMRSRFVSFETMTEWINASGGCVKTTRRGRLRVWLQISPSRNNCLS